MQEQPNKTNGVRLAILIILIATFAFSGLVALFNGPPTVDDWARGGLYLALAGVLSWITVKRIRI